MFDAWMSVPLVQLPERRFSNADMLDRVRGSFRGPPGEWGALERRLKAVFRLCESDWRHLEEERPLPLADHAVRAAEVLLREEGFLAEDLDLLIWGSIAREYFEPATAAEVSAKLGAKKALSFDIASACAGGLMSLQAIVGQFAIRPDLRSALSVTVAVPAGRIAYEMQTPEEALLLSAGLTIGSASSATLVTRERRPNSGRIVGLLAESLPEHHDLCTAPLDRPFVSRSVEIFALSRFLPDHVRKLLKQVGWRPGDVDHLVGHQPSNKVVRQLAGDIGVPLDRTPAVHHLYGNTESSAVALALAHVARTKGLKPGDKVVLVAAAGGFTMASLAVEWG